MNNLKEGTLLQNGKYKIIRFISSGGFGCTYEGVHTMLDTKVAIKEFFPKDFCNRDEATLHVTIGTESKRGLVEKLQKKFVKEAKILFKELHHPGIVRVTDIFEENGTAYYVMDYIDGCSLHDIVKRQGKLSEAKALKYIYQVCEALEYIHSKNRLHLDIKPANIMIEKSSDRAILIDFGTSKQYDEEDGENTSTLMGKTPGFAPPEQMGNDIMQFFTSTDIYSVGATLYKILTGITPPSATQLISGEDLEPIPTTVSRCTRTAVEQAMLLNKKKRPQTVREFLNILQQNEVVENTIIATKAEYNNEETQLAAETDTNYQPKIIAGHEYVDLGLPSGLKWATCNVGANKPEEYGDYFAWGETETKTEYTGENCKTIGIKKRLFGDNKIIDKRENFKDAARANWGGSWRLPTKEEMEELKNKCTSQLTTQSGVNGCKVTGPNGNSIFLPAAGYCTGSSPTGVGELGGYWSSTPDESGDDLACDIYFGDGDHFVFWGYRYVGHSVRPVSD